MKHNNLLFCLCLLLVEMAQTKHTPKNPQMHRPVTAVGRDVQPPQKTHAKSTCEGRETA